MQSIDKSLIIPDPHVRSHRTAYLNNTTYMQIVSMLGEPNVADDAYKVRYSWGFRYKDTPMAVWDWKGSADYGTWSIYGPVSLWYELFPDSIIEY